MLKITYEKNFFSHEKFALRKKNTLKHCSLFITLFGKTFHIKYSSKFNYFYITKEVRKAHEILDVLATSFVMNIIQEHTKKNLLSLVKFTHDAAGRMNDYIFRGSLDKQDVFIKVVLTRTDSTPLAEGFMQNEYEKGLLVSSENPHFVKPLYYIHHPFCEILITPFIQNARTLNEIMNSSEPAPAWIRKQIVDITHYLKNKRMLHRDPGSNNLLIGNLENEEPRVFLIDCAYMTFLDDAGKAKPIAIESFTRGHPQTQAEENAAFARMLRKLDKRLTAD